MANAAVLTILRNGETVRSCPIEGEVVLGRAEGCVIRLEDRAISRHHALFKLVNGAVQVEKKSEFAPIMVNGAECTSAILKEADVIAIGPYLMKVTLEKLSAAPAAAFAATSPAPVLPPLDDVGTLPVSPELDATMAPDAAPLGDLMLDAPGGAAQPASSMLALESASSAAESLPMDAPALDSPMVEASNEGGELPDFDIGAAVGGAAAPVEAPGEVVGFESLGLANVSDTGGVELADDNAQTKVAPLNKLSVALIFEPGVANVTHFEIKKDETFIGRGKDCDIVLNDKKSSRKNAVIVRSGSKFSIRDLDSSNGTYVNGVKVAEQELAGDDVIRIGAAEFKFVAQSADYAARAVNFLPVPQEPEASAEDAGFQFSVEAANPAATAAALAELGAAQPASAQSIPGLAGLPGMGAVDTKKMTFFEKVKNFRKLSQKDKLIVGGILLGLIYFALDMFDEEANVKTPAKKPGVVASGTPGALTFEMLSPEKQRFVEAQRNLAFEYFKNKEYDKALYELEKIWAIIPEYKDARDIERFSREGKRKLEAIEEEKRRKEEEARLKLKIQALVEECRDRMKQKHYDQARELFTQISILDPDNAQVALWKKEIEDYEEAKRLEELTRQNQKAINQRAWEVYREGLGFKKVGRYHTAIKTFVAVKDIGASDKKVLAMSAYQIQACAAAIRALRDPVLSEAKQAEDAGEFARSFGLYQKATKIDPPHPVGHAGMARVRLILHDRAKAIYTEAVLAESYSDFATAKRKFQECLESTPADDLYHDRAQRKLARYFKNVPKEGGTP